MRTAGREQLEGWKGKFGTEYTSRNDLPAAQMETETKRFLGKTYKEIFSQLLGKYRLKRVLEVGCNLGKKLEIFHKLSPPTTFYGIEPQADAVAEAHRRCPRFNIIEGNVYDLPFKDGFFDLVFTAGVLIHIPPRAIKTAMAEICRVSGKYVMGLEYWEKREIKVVYRGRENLLWKMDYPRAYLKNCPELSLKKEMVLEYRKQAFGKSGMYLNCFLLKKHGS